MFKTNFENFLNQYNDRGRTKILKKYKTKFKSIRSVITLDRFKEIYIKDFYTQRGLKRLKKVFNIDNRTLKLALMNRRLLNKIVTRKYYFLFFPKQFPNRFFRRKRRRARRKSKKIKLRLRKQFLIRIPHDTFLFHLNILDKQLLIKPFNFCQSLYFFKIRKFKNAYIIRKKRRREKLRRFKYVYRFGRKRRKRRIIGRRSRRPRYIKYRFKRKFWMKKLKQRKLKRYKNFFKFIAFFKILKQHKLKLDDYSKAISPLHRPYKLLKFNFNKVTNSYNFFLQFNTQRKQKINIGRDNMTNLFNQEKTKLYSSIKVKLKNRFLLTNHNKIINISPIFSIKEKKNINFPDYLCYKTLIKDEIRKDYKTNILKNFIPLKHEKKKLFFLLKVIHNIFEKINFFQKLIVKLKQIHKKQLCLLLFNSVTINSHKEIRSKNQEISSKNEKIINIILEIILKFKNKVTPLMIDFSILYLKVNPIKSQHQTSFFFKSMLFFSKLKIASQSKENKNNIFLSLFSLRKKYLSLKYNDHYFGNDFIRPDYEYLRLRWKEAKFERKMKKKFKCSVLRRLRKNFIISDFSFYKTYFSKKQVSQNYNYCQVGNKKFMLFYEAFIKKSNKSNLINSQKKKNINFLN